MLKASPIPVLILLAALSGDTPAAEIFGSTGYGHGIAVHGGDTNPCPGSTLYLTYDGTGENGYCWGYGGMVPPYYGAFAEAYSAGVGYVCGIDLFLTQIGYHTGQGADLYVWDSDGVNPTAVLSVTAGVAIPGTIAFWPSISEHGIGITPTAVSSDFFVGCWGNWPGTMCPWYVAVDADGMSGSPRTNIAPGIGYPTGWQDVAIVWGPTPSLGIGAFVSQGTPVRDGSWGSVKRLYR